MFTDALIERFKRTKYFRQHNSHRKNETLDTMHRMCQYPESHSVRVPVLAGDTHNAVATVIPGDCRKRLAFVDNHMALEVYGVGGELLRHDPIEKWPLVVQLAIELELRWYISGKVKNIMGDRV